MSTEGLPGYTEGMPDEHRPRDAITTLVSLFLVYTVAVIVFGAWVRITGSGAGCGQHWPTCHGEVLHRPETMETVIELTHRVTSGLAGLMSVALLLAAFVRRRTRPRMWAGALATVFFMVTESLIGAGIVKFELVADDASAARAIGVSVHLVNTALLTAALTWAAWGASMGQVPVQKASRPALMRGLAAAGIMLVVMMTGAVTALGDTLFPPDATGGHLAVFLSDQADHAHLLQRSRAIHPVVAVVGALSMILLVTGMGDHAKDRRVRRWCRLTVWLILGQVGLGVLNIWLSAPGYMQLLHLGSSTATWITLVLALLSLRGADAGSTTG